MFDSVISTDLEGAKQELTVQRPPTRLDNINAPPFKSLPVEETGSPIGVGTPGPRAPFETVGAVTPLKQVPAEKQKPPISSEADDLLAQSWWDPSTWDMSTIALLSGGALLLLIVLFQI